jgi:hypothetical protein
MKTRPKRWQVRYNGSPRGSKLLIAVNFVDDVRFQALLSKLHAYVADDLRSRYSQVPSGQHIMDTMPLHPPAHLPGASLTDFCTHFREHHALSIDQDRFHEPGYQDTLEDTKRGPKYERCLIIDDESPQSIENGSEPHGAAPSEGAKGSYRRNKVFVKLLSSEYTTMEEPLLLSAHDRRGTVGRIEWEGWLKFSPGDLMRVFDETNSGDIDTYYRGPDGITRFT